MATAADVAAVRARIAGHQTSLNTLQGEIDALRAQTVSFNTEGNNAKEATAKANSYTTEITKKITELETKMNGYYTTQRELIKTMAASVLEQAVSMVEALGAETESRITREVGMVESITKQIAKRLDNTRNPVTGEAKPYEGGYVSLLGLHRNEGLTAEEYDALDLPAESFASYGLSCAQYDISGASLLV